MAKSFSTQRKMSSLISAAHSSATTIKKKLLPHQVRDIHEHLRRSISSLSFETKDRQRLQNEVAAETLRMSKHMTQPNFMRSADTDLQRMAELYDRIFFESALLPLAQLHGLSFRWSPRMTRTGGKTTQTVVRDRRTGERIVRYEIALSSTLLGQTFRDVQRPIRVSGMLCNNRLEAMQRIMEHELIHLAEMLVWLDSCCSARRFQSIAHRFFGHTEHRHELMTQNELAAEKFNVKVGSRVVFRLDGTHYRGIVNRITRRATILVPHANGEAYNDGKRYLKFYVPVSQLTVEG